MNEPRKRRAKGDGSLLERAPGVWRLRVYLSQDPATGSPIQADRTVRGNRTKALQELRKFVQEVNDGKVVKHKGTVANLLDRWMAHQETVAGRAPLTVQERRRQIAKHIGPALGHVELPKLTTADLDDYYKQKIGEGLSPGTVRLHHNILSAALNQALRWQWIGRNPAATATPPTPPKSSKRAPTPQQVRALVDVCGDDIDLATAIVLGAITGARRGELCGLQWDDVDWEDSTLRIERQRYAVGAADRTGPVKNREPRTVALGDGGIAILERYRRALLDRADRLGVGMGVWLLSYDCGHTPLRPGSLGEAIRQAGRRAGVPVSSHLLRYFAATQMVGAGVDVRTAAGRLGHTPELMLRVYADFMPSRDAEAARGLETLVLGEGDTHERIP